MICAGAANSELVSLSGPYYHPKCGGRQRRPQGLGCRTAPCRVYLHRQSLAVRRCSHPTSIAESMSVDHISIHISIECRGVARGTSIMASSLFLSVSVTRSAAPLKLIVRGLSTAASMICVLQRSP
jgi:hypothetical protein